MCLTGGTGRTRKKTKLRLYIKTNVIYYTTSQMSTERERYMIEVCYIQVRVLHNDVTDVTETGIRTYII